MVAAAAAAVLRDALGVSAVVVGYNVTNNPHRQHPFGQTIPLRVMGTAAYRF